MAAGFRAQSRADGAAVAHRRGRRPTADSLITPPANISCRPRWLGSGAPGAGLSDSGEIGRRDPAVQVPADGAGRLVVPPVDVLTIANELRCEGRPNVARIPRPGHPVPLTYHVRLEEPGVLAREDFLGDARPSI